jgi:hypothetical protein
MTMPRLHQKRQHEGTIDSAMQPNIFVTMKTIRIRTLGTGHPSEMLRGLWCPYPFAVWTSEGGNERNGRVAAEPVAAGVPGVVGGEAVLSVHGVSTAGPFRGLRCCVAAGAEQKPSAAAVHAAAWDCAAISGA